jgi:hypothetical protein
MKIIFKTSAALPAPTFNQVEEDQFFINDTNELCQKRNSCSYNVIASADGTPYAVHRTGVADYMSIKRILPLVERIEF